MSPAGVGGSDVVVGGTAWVVGGVVGGAVVGFRPKVLVVAGCVVVVVGDVLVVAGWLVVVVRVAAPAPALTVLLVAGDESPGVKPSAVAMTTAPTASNGRRPIPTRARGFESHAALPPPIDHLSTQARFTLSYCVRVVPLLSIRCSIVVDVPMSPGVERSCDPLL